MKAPRFKTRPKYVFLHLILSLCIAIELTSCQRKQNAVSGQVFIVTRGAENVKLGDVDIFLIEKKDVLNFLQDKDTSLKNGLATRNREVEDAKREVSRADAEYQAFLLNKPFTKDDDYVHASMERDEALRALEAVREKHKSIESQNDHLRATARATLGKRTPEYVYLDFKANSLINLKWRPIQIQEVQPASYESLPFVAWRDFLNAIVPQMNLLVEQMGSNEHKIEELGAKLTDIAKRSEDAQKQKIPKAQARLEDAEKEKDDFLLSFKGTIFNEFPGKFAQEVHTDADGKFTFSYPQSKEFVFFAKAERNVINKIETYFWLVNTPNDVKPLFILSNSKLTEVDPDGFLKFARQF